MAASLIVARAGAVVRRVDDRLVDRKRDPPLLAPRCSASRSPARTRSTSRPLRPRRSSPVRSLDVSADGSLIVYTAGPGTVAFAPTPANVYLVELGDSGSRTRAVVVDHDGAPGAARIRVTHDLGRRLVRRLRIDQRRPCRGRTGSSVVAPFAVGIDRGAQTAQVLVDDAAEPAVSSDGLHVAYQRNGAVRVLSSTGVDAVDSGPDELAAAQPSGPVAISQHGRWLVFASAADLRTDPDPTAEPAGSRALSGPQIEPRRTPMSSTRPPPRTTTTTVAETSTTTSNPSTSTTSPGVDSSTTTTEVATVTTVPASTLPATRRSSSASRPAPDRSRGW